MSTRCACGGRWEVLEPTKNGLGYKLECSRCDRKRTVVTSVALALIYSGEKERTDERTRTASGV